MARTLRLSEPAATTVTDELGRTRLVVLAIDAHGKVWANPDALNGADWEPLSNKTKDLAAVESYE
jgi:hypothetical protein